MSLVRPVEPDDYVLFGNESHPSVIVSNVEEKRKHYKYFEFTVLLTHWVGIIFIVLDGYFFGTTQAGLQWRTEASYNEMPGAPHSHGLINMHGFFMTTAFIFFQGEALITYRVYRHEVKIFSKTLHVLFHTAALASASFALTAIARNKANDQPNFPPRLYSFHSWLGVAVFSAYILQYIIGFVNYAYPKTHIEIRRFIMPFHRIAGALIFVMSVVTVLVGHQRYWCFAFRADPKSTYDGEACDRFHNCTKRLDLILNFSTLFLLAYVILVLIVIRVDEWIRVTTPDEKTHTD